jgi:hypothetical protein
MALQSKSDIAELLIQSGKRMKAVAQRKATERATELQQEAEARSPSPIDLTRK